MRTTNAIERPHEEFKRRIKTHTVLRCAETAAMLFWDLLGSGRIIMRKVEGWRLTYPLILKFFFEVNDLRQTPRFL